MQKVQPEKKRDSNSDSAKTAHMAKSVQQIVSVREKVIAELRQVQERISENDTSSDVAIEYCIKMITTNQLHEQDFDF